MGVYATIAQVRGDGKTNSSVTFPDSEVLTYIEWASDRIDSWLRANKGYTPEPYLETRNFDVPMYWQRGGDGLLYLTLDLEGYLLETPVSVTLPDASALASQDYRLLRESSSYPYHALQLKSDALGWYDVMNDDTTPQLSIEVEGVWGYRYRYATEGWAIGSTLNGAINASTTSVTVTSGTLFAIGQLIRVDSEYMRVTAVSTNTLTVTRGVNGSSSDAHNNAVSVYIYHPENNIVRACVRATAYMLSRQGNFAVATFDGVATTSLPKDLPEEVTNILSELPRVTWGVM